jgi:hypothetical protein
MGPIYRALRDLTRFSKEAVLRPRGRNSELGDLQIQNRRDQFVQIFEGSWGDIGWTLQRCKKPSDLIGIFKPIADPKSWVHGPPVQTLNDFSFEASPAFTARIQETITRRTADLEVNRQRMRNAWWNFAAAVLLTLVGSAVAWEFVPLLSPYFAVDQKQLQLAILLLLFLPSLVASVLLPIFGHLSFGGFAKEGLLS